MPLWKQFLFTLALLLGAGAVWIGQSPAAGPFLDRYRLAGLVSSLGLPVAPAPAGEPPARSSQGAGQVPSTPTGQAGAPQPGAPGAGQQGGVQAGSGQPGSGQQVAGQPGAGQQSAGQQGGRPPGGGGGPVPVRAEPPAEMLLDDVAEAIGSGRAARTVALESEVSGQITELAVSAGERVERGQLIVALDDQAARIAQDRARLTLEDARTDAARLERLHSSGSATDVQLREADLALRTAELALREAEFDLSRRRIIAPIAGSVGFLAVEQGDQVGPGKAITQIDDRSSLIVEFRLPERVVGLVAPGMPMRAAPLARPEEVLEGRISALDNRVDEVNRTLRVQAQLDNPQDALRAGMSFSITIDLPGQNHPAVDPLSIQWSRDGAYIWVVRDGKADRLPVTILQRGSDRVLLDATFAPGDLVVIEGVQSLRPGSAVAVQ